jgi:hypothetical protein
MSKELKYSLKYKKLPLIIQGKVDISNAIVKSSQDEIFQFYVCHIKLFFLLTFKCFPTHHPFQHHSIFLTCFLQECIFPFFSCNIIGFYDISVCLFQNPNSVSLLSHCCHSFLLISLIVLLWSFFPICYVFQEL